MKHILAAIDGSKASYRALQLAVGLAKRLGASLTILVVRQLVLVWSNEEVRAILDKAKEAIAAAAGPQPTIVETKLS